MIISLHNYVNSREKSYFPLPSSQHTSEASALMPDTSKAASTRSGDTLLLRSVARSQRQKSNSGRGAKH